jgi:hypothetical protein
MENLIIPKDFTGVIRLRSGESVEVRNMFYKLNGMINSQARTNNGPPIHLEYLKGRYVTVHWGYTGAYTDLSQLHGVIPELLTMERLKKWKN